MLAAMPVTAAELRVRARRLRDAFEPIAGAVYFLPECRERYVALGLADFGPAYFASRGGCIGGGKGPVSGEMVVAAFGVFSPAMVIPAVEHAWSVTDAATLLSARERGTVEGLTRILGADPHGLTRATELLRAGADAATGEGRALFSGLRSLGWPGDPVGDLWRAADLVREHRGDSHIAAWISHGLGPVEAQILLELWWRRPVGPYTRTRGWTDEQIASTWTGLQEKGYVAGEPANGSFTAEGEALRASIEDATDRQELSIIEAIGEHADELLDLLRPWALEIIAAKAYPSDPASYTRP